MQNQIMNQLLLFGIQPGDYQITTHPAGETEITVLGNTVAIIPMIGRKAIQLNREWTLDRIPGDSVILAVSAVVTALLRCRHTAIPISPLLGAMVETKPSLCGGETATIPRLGIYATDNHSPEEYE